MRNSGIDKVKYILKLTNNVEADAKDVLKILINKLNRLHEDGRSFSWYHHRESLNFKDLLTKITEFALDRNVFPVEFKDKYL